MLPLLEPQQGQNTYSWYKHFCIVEWFDNLFYCNFVNVVKNAKFVLFFDTFIRDLENQAKDLVSRLKNMKVHVFIYL